LWLIDDNDGAPAEGSTAIVSPAGIVKAARPLLGITREHLRVSQDHSSNQDYLIDYIPLPDEDARKDDFLLQLAEETIAALEIEREQAINCPGGSSRVYETTKEIKHWQEVQEIFGTKRRLSKEVERLHKYTSLSGYIEEKSKAFTALGVLIAVSSLLIRSNQQFLSVYLSKFFVGMAIIIGWELWENSPKAFPAITQYGIFKILLDTAAISTLVYLLIFVFDSSLMVLAFYGSIFLTSNFDIRKYTTGHERISLILVILFLTLIAAIDIVLRFYTPLGDALQAIKEWNTRN
jgi:hypothetical protein